MTTPTSTTSTALLKGTLTPQRIMASHLPRLWAEYTPEEKRLCQKQVVLMLEAKLEGLAIVPVAAIEFFKIACGASNYKNDAVAKAIVRNGLGLCRFHGEVITPETLHKTETENPQTGVGTGQGRTLNAGGIRVTTLHSWKCRFELPSSPSEIPSLEAYQTLALSIETDHTQLQSAYAEVTRLASLALAQCEDGRLLLAKIGSNWAKAAVLKAELDQLAVSYEGIKALGDKPYLKAALVGLDKEMIEKAKAYELSVKKAQEVSAPIPLKAIA